MRDRFRIKGFRNQKRNTSCRQRSTFLFIRSIINDTLRVFFSLPPRNLRRRKSPSEDACRYLHLKQGFFCREVCIMCSNCGSNSEVCSASKIQTVCSSFFFLFHFTPFQAHKKKTWSLKSIIKNMSAVNEIISVNLRCEINPPPWWSPTATQWGGERRGQTLPN